MSIKPKKRIDAGVIVMLAYPGAEIIDIAGPLDILCLAPCVEGGEIDVSRQHESVIVSEFGGLVTTQPSGITIQTESLASVSRKKIDMLIVPGGNGTKGVLNRPRLVQWIRKTAVRARRVVSVCTGAFLLAEAGLLDGKRATTHWMFLEEFTQRYPQITVEPDSIFVANDDIFTSAGVTSGMDLALHLVEKDWGADVSLFIARMCLLYTKRPGGQSQFSAFLPKKPTEHDTISEL